MSPRSTFKHLIKYLKTSHYNSPDKLYKTYQVKIDDLTVNYAKCGQGKPLVFVHGWTNNWEGWAIIFPYLSKFFTVYSIDLPGFGDSDNLPHYSVQLSAKYVAGFLTSLPDKCEALIGMSMGSFVVAETARGYHQFMKKAVLVAPVLKNEQQLDTAANVYKFLKAMRRFMLTQKLVKNVVALRLSAYITAKFLTMYHFDKNLVDIYGLRGKKRMRPQAFIDMGISASHYDMTKSLSNISVPTQLIIGVEDKIVSRPFVKKEILPRNNKLSLVEVPSAGHVVHWEHPAQVAQIIKDFVNKPI